MLPINLPNLAKPSKTFKNHERTTILETDFFGQIFDQIFGQVFDRIFDQDFDQPGFWGGEKP